MKTKVFIIWADYDGEYVEEFDDIYPKSPCEKRINQIKRLAYGSRLIAVIQGQKL